jgi:hypothetical protein
MTASWCGAFGLAALFAAALMPAGCAAATTPPSQAAPGAAPPQTAPAAAPPQALAAAPFAGALPADARRVWIGPEYWANRLQDWRLSGGRIECVTSGSDRNIHLLTRQVGPGPGDVDMSVRLGSLAPAGKLTDGWAGFRVGIIGQWKDYRDSVRVATGMRAGVTTAGRLFIGNPAAPAGPAAPAEGSALPLADLVLRLVAAPDGDGVRLTLTAALPDADKPLAAVTRKAAADALTGNVALVCDAQAPAGGRAGAQAVRGNVRFWFRDWRVAGSRVEARPEHAFGPILWAQYTLSGGVLKLSAQMPPVGEADAQAVRLEVRPAPGGAWQPAGDAPIDPHARTASFRVADWDDSRDVPYRLVYPLKDAAGATVEHAFEGVVRRNPADKDTIVLAAFTGNADYVFPNNDLVRHVTEHDPDLLFFSGDNIYENVGGYGCQRQPLDEAVLEYLRKWYFYGWAYRDLLRGRPAVSVPDDHDVFQGNLWGAGGRAADKDDKGGYVMPAEWVKAVERTQTSHLPDPVDPRPAEQGIGVYFTRLEWGGVSFAVLEDRKFKSGPSGLVPPTTSGRADHVLDPAFDPKLADVPGATLLGERQLAFLNRWAEDWTGAQFKCVLSQTIFCGAATHHGGGLNRLYVDYDSNGWPQTGRRKALDAMRRGFAFHVGGDQHLATIVHQGLDDWGDGPWSFAVPSVANFYLRAWKPEQPGRNRAPGAPEYTGEFLDGLGNRITMWAATNPGDSMGVEPAAIHDKKPGYGIVRFRKSDQTITMECWPLFADPKDPKAAQYAGWPKTVRLADNYARKPAAYLPTLRFKGMAAPVVQVIDESSGEIVYTRRVLGPTFRPPVFAAGTYAVKAGEPGTPRMRTLAGLKATADGEENAVEVGF